MDNHINDDDDDDDDPDAVVKVAGLMGNGQMVMMILDKNG